MLSNKANHRLSSMGTQKPLRMPMAINGRVLSNTLTKGLAKILNRVGAYGSKTSAKISKQVSQSNKRLRNSCHNLSSGESSAVVVMLAIVFHCGVLHGFMNELFETLTTFMFQGDKVTEQFRKLYDITWLKQNECNNQN